MNAKARNAENITLYTILILLIGALGVFASCWFAEAATPRPGSVSYVFVITLTTLSISLFGFGLFSFALDTKNWRDYFADRLKDIVIEKDYLQSLDADTLKDLQTRVLKAQFKNPNIDKEGSFLHFFHNNLHRYISEPYREDVSSEMILSEEKDSCFLVTDRVVYVCRSSANKIQSSIRWAPDDGEFERVNSLKVSVRHPQGDPRHEFPITLFDKRATDDNLNRLVEIPLKEYELVDGLIVTIESQSVLKSGRLQNWQMAHPTKNFSVTFSFPPAARLRITSLFQADIVSRMELPGYLNLKYNSWLLPHSGLAWVIT